MRASCKKYSPRKSITERDMIQSWARDGDDDEDDDDDEEKLTVSVIGGASLDDILGAPQQTQPRRSSRWRQSQADSLLLFMKGSILQPAWTRWRLNLLSRVLLTPDDELMIGLMGFTWNPALLSCSRGAEEEV
ncbi:unnamed protein product [Pleuronectes platessa]|uniref:Uncharacterized protein n=1 Tax=Pleuronectes platessa TaxID=8262 RepID=A0A9N7UY10_PLEPL|nr:unnamed protein product [Pleuronectes platessa]